MKSDLEEYQRLHSRFVRQRLDRFVDEAPEQIRNELAKALRHKYIYPEKPGYPLNYIIDLCFYLSISEEMSQSYVECAGLGIAYYCILDAAADAHNAPDERDLSAIWLAVPMLCLHYVDAFYKCFGESAIEVAKQDLQEVGELTLRESTCQERSPHIDLSGLIDSHHIADKSKGFRSLVAAIAERHSPTLKASLNSHVYWLSASLQMMDDMTDCHNDLVDENITPFLCFVLDRLNLEIPELREKFQAAKDMDALLYDCGIWTAGAAVVIEWISRALAIDVPLCEVQEFLSQLQQRIINRCEALLA